MDDVKKKVAHEAQKNLETLLLVRVYMMLSEAEKLEFMQILLKDTRQPKP